MVPFFFIRALPLGLCSAISPASISSLKTGSPSLYLKSGYLALASSKLIPTKLGAATRPPKMPVEKMAIPPMRSMAATRKALAIPARMAMLLRLPSSL